MSDNFDFAVVDKILDAHQREQKAIIAILQEIQEHYHYLPQEVFPRLAQELGMSEARIFSVATFYENFSLEPKGKYLIKVCDGTACHVRHSQPILERLRRDLGLAEGQKTTPDLNFTLETVACIGACVLAPVITINDKTYPSMTPDKASELIKQLKEEIRNAQD